jgi:hypothetical protein
MAEARLMEHICSKERNMPLAVANYLSQRSFWPDEGKHILAQFDAESVVVYQAFRPGIAHYAVANGHFGGSKFSFNRMSWIKPNFLWMMYRCGWATKENQEAVLAVHLRREGFEEILRQAVPSTFSSEHYEERSAWQKDLSESCVRLQWDPDHDPHGAKLSRRAIQLGLRGEILKSYSGPWILAVEDITDFVHAQHATLKAQGISSLVTPKEEIYPVTDPVLKRQLGITDEESTG